MSDVVIKFQGGSAEAKSCGSKNPMVAALAMSILNEGNQYNVAHAQEAHTQHIGNAMQLSGIALG